MEIRSFLAFELPSQIKKIIGDLSRELRKFPMDVRWVKTDNIHLTVVFMGNTHTEHLLPIDETVSKVCLRFRPFNVSLKGCGVFGSRRNPRVLWIGIESDNKRILYFRDSLQKHLRYFGTKEEKRSFRPHLTLGRFRKGAKLNGRMDGLLSKFRDLTSPVFTLGELTLFKSDLKPGGSVYTRMNVWPLKGSND